MINANRFGLSRDIPESVCREVRQQSGFGCVICAAAIIEYHHFNPPFSEAHIHSPKGITALCPSCHTKVHSGRISSAALLDAVQHPLALQIGYSHDRLEANGPLTVILGGLTLIDVPIVLEVAGRILLGFSRPDASGAPVGVNALFCDNAGKPIAEIVDNQWRASSYNWDVSTVGIRTVIRGSYRDVSLIFRSEPPSTIVVESIHMFYKDLRLEGHEGSHLSAYLPNGRLWFRAANTAVIAGCAKGIVLGAT
ncbi:MAG TPA: hypothetical protein PKG95_04435 [Anaerolineaceae bacterium]|nr:hypothetical protein [Anaerolineaceae bacterium]